MMLPYVKNITDSLKTCIRNAEVTLGYQCLNRLDRVIRVHKDKLKKEESSDVVYKIFCKDCDSTWVRRRDS